MHTHLDILSGVTAISLSKGLLLLLWLLSSIFCLSNAHSIHTVYTQYKMHTQLDTLSGLTLISSFKFFLHMIFCLYIIFWTVHMDWGFVYDFFGLLLLLQGTLFWLSRTHVGYSRTHVSYIKQKNTRQFLQNRFSCICKKNRETIVCPCLNITRICTLTWLRCLHAYMHVRMHAWMFLSYVFLLRIVPVDTFRSPRMHACMPTCTHECMNARIHTSRVYVCIHVCMRAYTYVCVHVAYTRDSTPHTHAYTRIHTHTHAYTRIHTHNTHTHAYTRIHTHTHA